MKDIKQTLKNLDYIYNMVIALRAEIVERFSDPSELTETEYRHSLSTLTTIEKLISVVRQAIFNTHQNLGLKKEYEEWLKTTSKYIFIHYPREMSNLDQYDENFNLIEEDIEFDL